MTYVVNAYHHKYCLNVGESNLWDEQEQGLMQCHKKLVTSIQRWSYIVLVSNLCRFLSYTLEKEDMFFLVVILNVCLILVKVFLYPKKTTWLYLFCWATILLVKL